LANAWPYLPVGEDWSRFVITAKEFDRLAREGRQAFGMTQRELALAINTGERFVV
jgi:hypothetical protein